MYIEDLIDRLSSSGQYLFLPPLDIETRDQPLLSSFSDQILRGYGLSEKQASLAVKFCKKYRVQLSAVLSKDITLFTDNPTFRLPIRKIAMQSKKVEVVEQDKVKSIKVSFPYDEKLLADLAGVSILLSWITSLATIGDHRFRIPTMFLSLMLQAIALENIRHRFTKVV